jgi:hypothetical protein
MGPGGQPVLTPDLLARRQQRQKALADRKAAARKERVEKLKRNLINKLSIYTESARGEDDRAVTESFKVRFCVELGVKCRLIWLAGDLPYRSRVSISDFSPWMMLNLG